MVFSSLPLTRLAFSFLTVLFAFGARLFTLRFPHCSPLQAFLHFMFSVFILIAMWPVRWALDQDFHSFISISYLFSVRFCNYLRFCRMLNCLCKYLTILHFTKAKAAQRLAATCPIPSFYARLMTHQSHPALALPAPLTAGTAPSGVHGESMHFAFACLLAC